MSSYEAANRQDNNATAEIRLLENRQRYNDNAMVHRGGNSVARLPCRALVVAVIGGWTATAQAAQSLFDSADRPQTESVRDTRATELGVRFNSSQKGVVPGVRFYKGPRNCGTHTGGLWTATGQRLATGVFQNETSSGWQTLKFATPVPIKADTVYVASYWTPIGSYAHDRNYFKLARHNGPLTAITGNGIFRTGSSGFPTRSHQRSNY